MVIGFHFCFKYSAGGREDFAKVSDTTGILSRHLEKHCTSQWISLDKFLVKLIEQYDNLKEYFLNTLPTLPGFNGKRGITSTARYICIREYLTDKLKLILIHFVVSVAQDFQSFMKPLQNQKPIIYVLHSKCMDPIHLLLQRFIKNYKVMRSKEPTKQIGANKLVDLNIDDVSNHKVIT